MKSLSSYTESEISNLFDENGAFWAFSNKQFDEAKKEGVYYVRYDIGFFCPKENAESLVEKMSEVYRKGEDLYLEENGIENIILDELANQECYYTGDWQDAYESTKRFGATEEQVLDIYKKQLKKQQDQETLPNEQPVFNLTEAKERILNTDINLSVDEKGHDLNTFSKVLKEKGYNGFFHTQSSYAGKVKDSVAEFIENCKLGFEVMPKDNLLLTTYLNWKDDEHTRVKCNLSVKYLDERFYLTNMLIEKRDKYDQLLDNLKLNNLSLNSIPKATEAVDLLKGKNQEVKKETTIKL